MTNLQKYNKAFKDILHKEAHELPGLKYQGFPAWDSVGHMDLVAELEEIFDIRLETLDVLDFSTYEKGKEVLARYDVIIEG